MNQTITLASWPRRALCYVIDQYALVPFVFAYFAPHALRGIIVSVGVGFWIWSTFIHQGRTGRSVGRMLTKSRLVDETTLQPIGGWRTFLRSIVHTLDFILLGLGFLRPIWNSKRQTWADSIMGTIVVVDPITAVSHQSLPPYPAVPAIPLAEAS